MCVLAPIAGSQANTHRALCVPEASAVGHPGWTGSAGKHPVLWGVGGGRALMRLEEVDTATSLSRLRHPSL